MPHEILMLSLKHNTVAVSARYIEKEKAPSEKARLRFSEYEESAHPSLGQLYNTLDTKKVPRSTSNQTPESQPEQPGFSLLINEPVLYRNKPPKSSSLHTHTHTNTLRKAKNLQWRRRRKNKTPPEQKKTPPIQSKDGFAPLTVFGGRGVLGVELVVLVDEHGRAVDGAVESVVPRVAGHEVRRGRLEAEGVEKPGDARRDHGAPVVVVAVPHAGHEGDLHVTWKKNRAVQAKLSKKCDGQRIGLLQVRVENEGDRSARYLQKKEQCKQKHKNNGTVSGSFYILRVCVENEGDRPARLPAKKKSSASNMR